MAGPPRPPRARRLGGLALRLGGMALLLVLFVRSIDGPATLTVLRGAPLWPAQGLALVLYAAGQVANGLGWRHLVRRAGIPVTVGQMVVHDLASVFWSVVLPGGIAGEVIKGARISGGLARAEATALAILAARLVGGGVAAGLALALLPWVRVGGAVRAVGVVALLGVLGVAVVGLGLLWAGPVAVRRLSPALAARLPPGRRPALAELLPCALGSLAAHLCFTGVYACYFHAAGAPLPIADAAFTYVLTTAAQALPITVGGLGVRELTMATVAAPVVGGPSAAAASVIGTFTFALPVLLGGLVEALRALRPPTSSPG